MSVSLKTLAEAAGVSCTTVSLALRNHPRISEATRTRVQRLAVQKGYHPNPELKRLMHLLRDSRGKNTTTVLACVHDDTASPEVLSALQARAAARGYRVDLFPWTGAPVEATRLDRIFNTRAIRGVFLHTPRQAFPLHCIHVERYCLCALDDCVGSVHRVSLAGAGADWSAREAVELMDALLTHNESGLPKIPKRVVPAEIPLETLARIA